ncbi:hypothetical protein CQA01_16200 [Cyclobacterium qasimii]|uniref:Uncharacterized protein n=1 Tax=Cyclobacterium qasimii TaxID=1350429 RepID=A0A512CA49_9BACT|nr:hypothetical protein CQA01_16200 [Cyclobacterium qasimii]
MHNKFARFKQFVTSNLESSVFVFIDKMIKGIFVLNQKDPLKKFLKWQNRLLGHLRIQLKYQRRF